MPRRAWRLRCSPAARIFRKSAWRFLLTPGFPWVAVQWGIWRAGGVAVPLPLNSTGLSWNTSSTTPRHRHWCSMLRQSRYWRRLPRPVASARCPMTRSSLMPPAELPDIASRTARHDSLHQRHDQPAQGRGHNSRQHYRANHEPGRSLGVVGRRSHRAVSCPCITCTGSSMLCLVRCGRARPARCCRASTRMRCGSASPAAA